MSRIKLSFFIWLSHLTFFSGDYLSLSFAHSKLMASPPALIPRSTCINNLALYHKYLVRYFSHLSLSFGFMIFFFLCRSFFLFRGVSFYLSLSLLLASGFWVFESHPYFKIINSLVFSPLWFHFFTFKSSIHLDNFFCRWLPSWSNTIYWAIHILPH